MYSFNLKNIDASGDLSCLFAKASIDESNKWHRRLGHVNFKNLNKLMKENLVRGLPFKIFENDHTCVACQKGKQHKAYCPKEANDDLHNEHFVLPIWSAYSTTVKSSGDKIQKTTDCKTCEKPVSQVEQIFQKELEKLKRQEKEANDAVRKKTTHENHNANTNSTNLLNVVSTPISTAGPSIALNDNEPSYFDDPSIPHLKDIYANPSEGIFTDLSYYNEGVVTDFNNLEIAVNVSPTPTTRIHTIHPKTQILRDPLLAIQTRSKANKNSEAHALISYIQKQQRHNHKDFQYCLFACFLSQIEPKKISQALEDETIETKWVYRNKKDEKGVVVRNKARLVAQGHRKKEGIDYDEVFALVARIEAIRIFLAFAYYMGFIVYQMDVKSALLYGTIDEEMSSMGELTFFVGLQVKHQEDAPHQDQSSFNQNYLQQPMPNPKYITDLTTAMNMALTLMAKAFKLNYSTPTNNNQRISSNPRNRQIAQPGMNMGQDRQMQMVGGNGRNQFRQYAGKNAENLAGGVGHYARNCTVRPKRRDSAYLQTQLLIAQKEEAGIQL
nr:hypothetical protein [Tanacetum cinerariifolium]